MEDAKTYICKYCGKVCKNKNSLAQHEIRCKENPNRIKVISGFHYYNERVKNGEIKKSHTNQFTKAKNLGLPIPEVSDETKIKLGNIWRGKKLPQSVKDAISKGMQRAVREHPESYSASNINGRVKKIEYNGIVLDGSWEIEVAKYLDSNNIKWERPDTGFEYFWENSNHIYYPDFYLPEYNIYIEVKGFERKRDIYKWQSVSNLIIIKQNEILKIKNNEYNIFDYLGL